jgi:hypothetical protein
VIPKAPIQAQILIGLFAVLAIAYGAAIIRLEDTSTGTRNAVPGQLIFVHMDRAWQSMTSSDPSVVAPISVSTSPTTRAFFIALKPGRATLRALPSRCTECLSVTVIWSIEVKVWPSG